MPTINDIQASIRNLAPGTDESLVVVAARIVHERTDDDVPFEEAIRMALVEARVALGMIEAGKAHRPPAPLTAPNSDQGLLTYRGLITQTELEQLENDWRAHFGDTPVEGISFFQDGDSRFITNRVVLVTLAQEWMSFAKEVYAILGRGSGKSITPEVWQSARDAIHTKIEPFKERHPEAFGRSGLALALKRLSETESSEEVHRILAHQSDWFFRLLTASLYELMEFHLRYLHVEAAVAFPESSSLHKSVQILGILCSYHAERVISLFDRGSGEDTDIKAHVTAFRSLLEQPEHKLSDNSFITPPAILVSESALDDGQFDTKFSGLPPGIITGNPAVDQALLASGMLLANTSVGDALFNFLPFLAVGGLIVAGAKWLLGGSTSPNPDPLLEAGDAAQSDLLVAQWKPLASHFADEALAAHLPGLLQKPSTVEPTVKLGRKVKREISSFADRFVRFAGEWGLSLYNHPTLNQSLSSEEMDRVKSMVREKLIAWARVYPDVGTILEHISAKMYGVADFRGWSLAYPRLFSFHDAVKIYFDQIIFNVAQLGIDEWLFFKRGAGQRFNLPYFNKRTVGPNLYVADFLSEPLNLQKILYYQEGHLFFKIMTLKYLVVNGRFSITEIQGGSKLTEGYGQKKLTEIIIFDQNGGKDRNLLSYAQKYLKTERLDEYLMGHVLEEWQAVSPAESVLFLDPHFNRGAYYYLMHPDTYSRLIDSLEFVVGGDIESLIQRRKKQRMGGPGLSNSQEWALLSGGLVRFHRKSAWLREYFGFRPPVDEKNAWHVLPLTVLSTNPALSPTVNSDSDLVDKTAGAANIENLSLMGSWLLTGGSLWEGVLAFKTIDDGGFYSTAPAEAEFVFPWAVFYSIFALGALVFVIHSTPETVYLNLRRKDDAPIEPDEDSTANLEEEIPASIEPDETSTESLEEEIPASLHKQRGDEHREAKNYEQAIKEYRQALLKAAALSDLELAQLYYGLGLVYLDLGNEERMLESFEQAIPRYQAALRGASRQLGYMHYRIGHYWHIRYDFKRAVTEYTKALENDYTKGLVYANRGLAYYSMGEYQLAYQDMCTMRDKQTKAPVAQEHLEWLQFESQGQFRLGSAAPVQARVSLVPPPHGSTLTVRQARIEKIIGQQLLLRVSLPEWGEGREMDATFKLSGPVPEWMGEISSIFVAHEPAGHRGVDEKSGGADKVHYLPFAQPRVEELVRSQGDESLGSKFDSGEKGEKNIGETVTTVVTDGVALRGGAQGIAWDRRVADFGLNPNQLLLVERAYHLAQRSGLSSIATSLKTLMHRQPKWFAEYLQVAAAKRHQNLKRVAGRELAGKIRAMSPEAQILILEVARLGRKLERKQLAGILGTPELALESTQAADSASTPKGISLGLAQRHRGTAAHTRSTFLRLAR